MNKPHIMNDLRFGFEQARQMLDIFLSDDNNIENIAAAGRIMVKSLNSGGKIISCGNGGSMCDAMHFAEELSGRFREDREPIAAISISDPSHITCTGNDYGFDKIFSRFIKATGKSNDVLLAISTSGNSGNIIEAARTARQEGMKVIALTGKDGGILAGLCDIEIRAPLSEYSDRVQEMHIKIIHSLILYIENNL
jgi:D-sedoheptulose 7-phosphate isomerase